MTTEPDVLTIPVEDIELDLLPSHARTVGSAEFQREVMHQFWDKYAAKGQRSSVIAGAREFRVLVWSADEDMLDALTKIQEAGRSSDAVPFLEGLALRNPDHAPILYCLGAGYSELERFDEALIRLKHVVSLDPQHALAWTAVGITYDRMGKQEFTLEPLRKAIEVAPDDGIARRTLGGILVTQGRTAEALEHLRAARRLMPDDAYTINALAVALDELGGDENLREARELDQTLIRQFPGSPFAERAGKYLTRRANDATRAAVGGGLRPDVMMYIQSALDTFDDVGPERDSRDHDGGAEERPGRIRHVRSLPQVHP